MTGRPVTPKQSLRWHIKHESCNWNFPQSLIHISQGCLSFSALSVNICPSVICASEYARHCLCMWCYFEHCVVARWWFFLREREIERTREWHDGDRVRTTGRQCHSSLTHSIFEDNSLATENKYSQAGKQSHCFPLWPLRWWSFFTLMTCMIWHSCSMAHLPSVYRGTARII